MISATRLALIRVFRLIKVIAITTALEEIIGARCLFSPPAQPELSTGPSVFVQLRGGDRFGKSRVSDSQEVSRPLTDAHKSIQLRHQ